METVSARRGHVRRPLLGNQELPVVPPQTWTHRLGAADSVEPAGDSAPATRPDVVLKLTGLVRQRSSSAPAAPTPTGSASHQRTLAPAPLASARSGRTKPHNLLPKLQCTATHTRKHVHVCV